MRHRMGAAAATHLGGNSSPELIPGNSSGSKERDAIIRAAAKECYELFFKGKKQRGIDMDGVDAGVQGDEVRIGIEPGYMYWPLKLISIAKDKEESFLITGYAWGPWGSDLRSKRREYGDYKKRGKFVKFIDKWHPLLFPTV